MRVLFFLIFITAPGIVFAQRPHVSKVADWFEQGYYILNPTISKGGQEVAFVTQLSGRDSTKGDRKTIRQVTQNFLPKTGKETRQFDPVITLFNTQKKTISLLDYGWAPAFSPNDNRIAYAFQTNALQKPDKLYADDYKGNTIKIFDRSSSRSAVVANPLGNYLLDPFFIDSLHLVYKSGDKVNGPFGGAISVNEVDLATGKTTPVRPPVIRHRLYELVGETYLINKRLAYIIYTPVDSGTGMANEYQHLLLSGKDTLHDFGVRRFTNLTYKFAVNNNSDVLFLDDEHFFAEDTNYLATYKNNRLISNRPVNFNYTKAFLSPNAKYILYIDEALDVYLVNVKDFSKTKLDRPRKEVHVVAWNTQTQQLVLVQDHKNLAGTDQLLMYKIR